MPRLPTTRDLRGNVVTIADLPRRDEARWTPGRKFIVVQAVRNGLISREEALGRYSMTEREFKLWEDGLSESGAAGLKITYLKHPSGPHRGETES